MSAREIGIKTYASGTEREVRGRLAELLRSAPIPEDQLLSNLGLFLNSKDLSRILFMDRLYRQALEVPGVIMEFGVRWGQNCALFAALRGIYEPFNRHRKIIGFDTFEGFPAVTSEDGHSDMIRPGNLAVAEGYQGCLEEILTCHEQDNPLAHLTRFELRKGDATVEIESYLREHPETIVAMAWFDFDLYGPTRTCLEAIRPRLVKGSVLGFDELNDPDSPGETLAVMEVLGLNNLRLKRDLQASRVAYCVVE
jgi:hypothetical protein